MPAQFEPGPHKIRCTPHARQRMDEMGLDRAAVLKALRESEVDYPTYSERRTSIAPPIAVVYHPVDRKVITVLYRSIEEYDRAQMPSLRAACR